MSWSVYTMAVPTNLTDRISGLEPPGEGTAEREQQVKAAKAAAEALISSGAVGEGEAFTVALSGHANPDHKPTSGYANDVLTVSVAQTTAAAVEQFDKQQAANLASEQ